MIALLNTYNRINGDDDEKYKAVVVGSEKLSAITDYSDRGTGILFADGAGAVVLERTGSDSGLLSASSKIDSELEGHLFCDYGGFITMDGGKVYSSAIELVTESCNETMKLAGIGPDEIALTVWHQANYRIIEAAAEGLGINMGVSIDRYGNTSAASVPIALNEAVSAGRIERGQNLLLAAFGGGMTVASALIRW
jgi:3-oxoacyl-[acyl-carrier-protein] synthase-3